MALRGIDLVYFLNFEMVYFIIFQNYLIKTNNHVKLKLFVFHVTYV
jgi:hypothetical protein